MNRQSRTQSNRRLPHIAAIGALAVALTSVGAFQTASAEIQSQEGCVEWSRESGCIVQQVCMLNTDTRHWVCVYHDTRDGSLGAVEGDY